MLKFKRVTSYLIILSLVMYMFCFASFDSNASSDGVYDFITRCYNIALGREPEQDGLEGWVQKLKTGETCGVSVAYGFVYSDEFQNAGYNNSIYIDKMYNMLLGREPDSVGKDYWLDNIENNGYTRYDIFKGFANSLEFYELCESYGIYSGYYISGSDMKRNASINGFVDRLYYLCLDRHGDIAGQQSWVNGIANGSISGTYAAYGFIFSNEYLNKKTTNAQYVTTLYNVFFNREPDTDGYNGWVDKLNKGTASREAVMLGFAKSSEFYQLCNAYGINVGGETFADYTYTPAENTPETSPTNTATPTSVISNTPKVTVTPTHEAKNTPDLDVTYEYNGKSYKVKSYKIDIDHEFLELYHENFVNKTDFTYNDRKYNLSNTYDSDYGFPIDLECDGTVYGFFLDDTSNGLNKAVNEYRAQNGWELYSIIDYELCRLRAIEGTVGGFELGHYRTNGDVPGSSNMAWAYNVENSDYFFNQYMNSSGHLAKWQGKGAWNLCTATFVRVKWIPDNTLSEGGYWESVGSCNNQMFISTGSLFSTWGTYEVYTGIDSVLHDDEFDINYNFYIVQGNAVDAYDQVVHLAWEDI